MTNRIMTIGNTSPTGYGSHDVHDIRGISSALMARDFKGAKQVKIENDLRKLVPLEYWRLMGMTDEDFHKADEVCSNTQLYQQAGNAIVVDVLEALFTNMAEERGKS